MAKTARAPKAPPNPDIKVAIDRYHDNFVAKFGFKPAIHGGKDGQHMGELLSRVGRDDAFWVLDEVFRTMDPQVVASDYTIAVINTRLAQRLLVRRSGAIPIDRRTAENLDVAMRASTPRN